MKPIFCTDITVNKNNTEVNGKEFITASVPEEKRAQMDAKADELQRAINGAKMPGWMVMLRSIAGFAALIMAMNLMQVAMEKGFSAIFGSDHITGTIICLGAVAIWFYLNRESKLRMQKLENDPELKKKNAELEVEIAMLMHEMGVPADAKDMDILVFNYKMKDGVAVPTSPMMLPSILMNFECKAFIKDDTLCLADSDSVYSFSMQDLILRKVANKITVYSWNKEDAPTDAKYATYGISINKMGMASMPYHYILEINREGETYGLYIPGYEAETLRELLGFESAIDADGDMVPLPCYVENEPLEDVAELSEKEGDLLPEMAETEANEVEEADEISATEEAETEVEESETEGETEESTEADEAEAEETDEADEADETENITDDTEDEKEQTEE